ncbi:hypothetical protein F4779DRAFT_596625 [Xylariaceae sp. FL0662B]|nr:hypothetical protein F4779DRAFT_596625 [Xylariaceae sp. FL0662B]
MAPEPQVHYCSKTLYVPNSKKPVLVYRQVLPEPHDEETAKELLERNKWLKGGAWGAYSKPHFHPNTHECYAVLKGSSTLLLGVGPLEDEDLGTLIHVDSGDVIILPAGVSHCSKESQEGYRYIGVYPKGSPHWRSEYCKDQEKCDVLNEEAESVAVPQWDPVRGYKGPLHQLWS